MSNGQDEPTMNYGLNPYIDSTTLLGKGAERFLARITYRCSLCQEEHNCEMYVTSATEDPAEQRRRFAESLMKQSDATALLIKYMLSHHEDQVDAVELALKLLDGPKPEPIRITHVETTTESDYTCDYCELTFDTIAALRIHLGQNPKTARTEGPGECRQAPEPPANPAG